MTNKQTIDCLINQSYVAKEGELRTVGNGYTLAFMPEYILDISLFDGCNYKVNKSIKYNIPLRYLF